MEVKAFFEKNTSTLTYVVSDPETRDALIIDSVLDFDPGTWSTSTEAVDQVEGVLEDDRRSRSVEYGAPNPVVCEGLRHGSAIRHGLAPPVRDDSQQAPQAGVGFDGSVGAAVLLPRDDLCGAKGGGAARHAHGH